VGDVVGSHCSRLQTSFFFAGISMRKVHVQIPDPETIAENPGKGAARRFYRPHRSPVLSFIIRLSVYAQEFFLVSLKVAVTKPINQQP